MGTPVPPVSGEQRGPSCVLWVGESPAGCQTFLAEPAPSPAPKLSKVVSAAVPVGPPGLVAAASPQVQVSSERNRGLDPVLHSPTVGKGGMDDRPGDPREGSAPAWNVDPAGGEGAGASRFPLWDGQFPEQPSLRPVSQLCPFSELPASSP